MDTKKVFLETSRLGNEINSLKQRVKDINEVISSIMNDCPHEIVFKYRDNHPRKMFIDGYYFCPACGKQIHCLYQGLYTSDFKNSRVIPLNNISLIGTKELLMAIRSEVFNNIDDYYNQDMNIEELALRMESILQEMQTFYREPIKILDKGNL